MAEFIIRITRQVEILQTVEERVIDAPNIIAAKREAMGILGEKYAGQPDVVAETKEKKPEDKSKKKVTEF